MSGSNIIFKITEAGLSEVFNAKKTGLEIYLTHIELGSGNKIPSGKETSLLEPKQSQMIGYGSQPSNNRISMTVAFPITSAFDVSEVGIWSGEPGNPSSILFAYYSIDSGSLITTTPGVDFVFTHDLIVEPAVAESINISIDPDASLFALHMSEYDPHPQYAKISDSIPPGQIGWFASKSPPTGWLEANGQSVSRTEYSKLFEAIGVSFGSDSPDKFNLPDLRGEFVRGWDNGRGVDAGRGIGTQQDDAIGTGNAINTAAADGLLVLTKYMPPWPATESLDGMSPGGAFLDVGNTSIARAYPKVASETRPRNVALLVCIKH